LKYWEIIADNLSKSRVELGRLIPTGERSGLLTRIAVTESVSLCVRMKSWQRFSNLKESPANQDAV
jgi:hypothetical protein